MEPDANRRAKLISDHVSGIRTLPSTEEAMAEYLSVDMEIDRTARDAEQLRASIRSKEKQQKKTAAAAQAAADTTKRNSDIIEERAAAARDEALRYGASAEEAIAAYNSKAEELKKVVEDATRSLHS